MTEQITIDSVVQYVQIVTELNNRYGKERFFVDNNLLFRGQADKDYELVPSIGRDRNSVCSSTIFNEERNLIEMAKFKMPDIFRNDLSPVELLALLQHHGIPTRLLDVTENALVALYFACSSDIARDKDAEVIVFKALCEDITNYPIVNAIADSYRFADATWVSLASFYAMIKVQPYFLEQTHTMNVVHSTNETGGEWIHRCCKQPMYIYAPIRSVRQQMQQGRYILFPNDITDDDNEIQFESMISPMPKDHKDIVGRIIIPCGIKEQILKDLAVLGITKSVLFCDNVDIVCDGIVKQFNQKLTYR